MEALQQAVEEIVGAPTYLVGGSVRDTLMGKEPKDWDFCTEADPDTVEAAVRAAGKHAYTIGKKFGTIGFKHEGKFIEVTTFRTETYDKTSRKPRVEFVGNLTHDLSRRDFTINSMAFRNGKLVDLFHGVDDISGECISAVGNARERFKEDPLRMLRAARFAAQFCFSVTPDTATAMKRYAHRILMVSRERWMQEMDKLLMSDFPEVGLTVLAETGVLGFMFPELQAQVGYDQMNPYHHLTLWKHTLQVVARTPADLNLRWAALLHDVGKPFCFQMKTPERKTYIKHDMVGAEMVRGIALRLRWSTERRETVVGLVESHMDDSSPLKPYDRAAKE